MKLLLERIDLRFILFDFVTKLPVFLVEVT